MKFVILTNNLGRFLKEKSYVLITIMLVFITIAAASFAVTLKTQKVHVGVSKGTTELLVMNGRNFSIKEVQNEKNYYTNLISGKYDAYITKENGRYKVTTVRSTTLKNKLSQYLNEGKSISMSASTENSNRFKIIISVLAMSSMVLSLILYRFYFDDRTGIDKRIYLSGVSNLSYILQQVLLNFLVLFIINLIGCVMLLPIFGLEVSWKLILYIFLVVQFAANFGMFLSTITKKNQGALLIGTMLSVLTMLLSGALFTVKKGTLQDKIHNLFPQYYISNLGKDIDGHSVDLTRSIFVIVVYTLLFFFFANYIQSKRMEE